MINNRVASRRYTVQLRKYRTFFITLLLQIFLHDLLIEKTNTKRVSKECMLHSLQKEWH